MPRIIAMISTEVVESLLWFILTDKMAKFSGHRLDFQVRFTDRYFK